MFTINLSDAVTFKLMDLADELAPKQNLDDFVDGWLRSTLGVAEDSSEEDSEEEEPLDETGT